MIRQYSSRVAARQRRKIYSTYLCGQNVTSVILQASRGQRAGRGEEQKLLSTYYTTSRGRLRCGYLQIRFRKFNFYSRENKTIEYIRNLQEAQKLSRHCHATHIWRILGQYEQQNRCCDLAMPSCSSPFIIKYQTFCRKKWARDRQTGWAGDSCLNPALVGTMSILWTQGSAPADVIKQTFVEFASRRHRNDISKHI